MKINNKTMTVKLHRVYLYFANCFRKKIGHLSIQGTYMSSASKIRTSASQIFLLKAVFGSQNWEAILYFGPKTCNGVMLLVQSPMFFVEIIVGVSSPSVKGVD